MSVVAFEKSTLRFLEQHDEYYRGGGGGGGVPDLLASRLAKYGLCAFHNVLFPVDRKMMWMWAFDNDTCALDTCRSLAKVKRCTGCNSLKYCSSACQSQDWAKHNEFCKLKASGSTLTCMRVIALSKDKYEHAVKDGMLIK